MKATRFLPGARNLSTRLLLAIVVVVVVGAATAWIVGVAIGPAVFHQHMMYMRGSNADATSHAEEAYQTASTLSLTIALFAALLASIAVSVLSTRRITRSLLPLTEAAALVAGGDYSARIPAAGIGSEFDDLTIAFNTMADDLGRIEASRIRMLGDLAHEMRTPVATIGAYLEAIADGVQSADTDTLAMLSDQVTRLSRLSEDIALVTTAEEGRLSMRWQRIGIVQLISDATAQKSAQYASGGIDLRTRISAEARDAVLNADVDRISQVLTNILDNALRHTPRGGAVTVGVAKENGHLVIAIRDTGDGIPSEHLPRIFDRFYRVDTSRDRLHGGSGVGLAIAKSITVAHGGSIGVSSDGSGRGTVFTIILPIAGIAVEPRNGARSPR